MWLKGGLILSFIFAVKAFNFYDECGLSKGCFGMPDNCIDRQDCQVVSSYSRKSPDLIHFEILGKAEINDYIALGLSQDPFMRNDSVVACTANEVKAFWNFYYYSLPMQDPVANLHEPFTEYQDGMIYCSFDYDSLAFIQTPPPAEIDLVLDLVNDEFHLLLSKGPFDVDDGKLSLHTQKAASDKAFSLIQFPLQLKSTENKQQDIYEGCGDNLQCWGIPDKCIDTKNCESLVKFTQDESSGDVSFQLYGNNLQTGSYVAVGLTEDQGMQDASVVHCYEENGNAGVGMSWNMNYGNIVLNDTSAIMDAKATMENGMLSCNFKWKKVSNVTVPGGNGDVVTFDLSISKKYHLILAKGAYDKSVLKQHSHTDRGKTSDKIDFAGGSDDDIYSDCGTADHQCFGFPDKCINNKSCESLVKFMQDESSGDVSFQLYGKNLKTGSYVAVGLTEDQGMQDASVVHCYEENGNAGVGMSWNMNYGNIVLNDTTAIMDAKATLENGMLSCNFKWKKVSNVTVPGGNGDVVTFDLSISKKYHLILAKGAYDKSVLKQHTSTDRWKTNDKIDFAGKPEVDIYSGCGKEKGCFGNSDNCIEGKNCSFVTRFQGVSNSSYMIEILGEISDDNKYVAVALSLDHLMGDDSVMACIWNETTSMAEVQMYWTDGYNSYSNDNTTKKFTTYPLVDPSQGITNTTGQLVDNQLYCSFVRDAKTSITPPGQEKAIDFDMNDTPYHILLAIGPLINDTKVGHHTDKAASSKTYSFSDFNTFLDTTYAGCGTTFGCFGIPDKCLDSFNCEVFTKYAQDENGDVSFNVYGPNLGANSYAAVAIVEESGMGDASVMFCYDHKNVNGVGMSWNEGISDSVILNDTTGGLSDMQASLTDGLLSCSFVRGKNTDITIPDDDNTIKTFDMSNKYYVLLAKGPISDGDSSLNFTLGQHTHRGKTAAPVDFSEFIVVKGKGQILLLVHGSLMILAWVMFASIGMLTARYGKVIHKNLAGKQVWFRVHQLCMIATWLLTVSSVIIIFIDKGTDPLKWSSIKNNAHSLIGLITSILCFIQPFMAFVRPDPDHDKRWLFNLGHFSFGTVAMILSVTSIVLVTQFQGYNFEKDDSLLATISAFGAFYVLMHICLTGASFTRESMRNTIVSFLLPLAAITGTAIAAVLIVLIVKNSQ